MPLTQLGKGTGYLKAGLLGFQKSGKSFTATQLAIGLRELFKLDGPIAMFDTETGSEYIAAMVEKATGKPLLGVKSRSFNDLMEFGRDCVKEKVSVGIVDSITHPWRELCDAYLKQINDKRMASNRSKLLKLEFMHWAAVKALWSEWTDFFLNSPLHIIICGRAGFEWDMERNDETGRNELIKTGVKMRVESEFGFEPSLLIEMERVQAEDKQQSDKFRLVHRARVLGDRFNVMDGAECDNPTFEFFKPHILMLKPGAHSLVDTRIKTQTGADEEGDGDWQREKRIRTILAEEIQGLIISVIPGLGAEDKKRKADLFQKVFNTRSWTAIENMRSEALRERIPVLKSALGIVEPPREDDGDLGPATDEAIVAGVKLLCKAHRLPEPVLCGYLAEKGIAKAESLDKLSVEALRAVASDWETIIAELKEAGKEP